jgi:hypothetical protein
MYHINTISEEIIIENEKLKEYIINIKKEKQGN